MTKIMADIGEKLLEEGIKPAAKTIVNQISPMPQNVIGQLLNIDKKTPEEIKGLEGKEAAENPVKIAEVKQRLFQEAQQLGMAQQSEKPLPQTNETTKSHQMPALSTSMTRGLTGAPEATLLKKRNLQQSQGTKEYGGKMRE